MIDTLIDLDKKLFLALNHFSGSGFDPLMAFLSGKVPWILFILGFTYAVWRLPMKYHRIHYLLITGSMILAYTLSEQSSVHLFKEIFMRLRPCHEPSLAGQVRLVADQCGGSYGFVSTHAANSFNLALLSALWIRQRWFTISVFTWALLVSYSRIYIGVHYPGDLVGGAVLGCLIATVLYFISQRIISRPNFKNRYINLSE